MGAKISPQMLMALDLIFKQGYSAYRAAKIAGVTAGAISKNRQYREWKEKQHAPSNR